MARTQIGGNRIANKSIGNEHLRDDLQIPESNINLKYASHNHENKSVLDIIKNSNTALVKELDLKDVVLTILQVSEARLAGKTLKNTIDDKGDKSILDDIVSQVNDAKGTDLTLKDAFDNLKLSLDDKINAHAGIISHTQLDQLYNDISNAKGDFTTLTDKIQEISNALVSGGSAGGSGGSGSPTINVQALTTWDANITLHPGEHDIILPNPYIVGDGSIVVHEGALVLTPGNDVDYVEVDSNTIRLNYDLTEDTTFRIIGTNSGRLFEWIYRLKSTKDQEIIDTMFNFTNAFDDLIVYEDGMLLVPDTDYIELSNHEIKLIQKLEVESNITICKRRY